MLTKKQRKQISRIFARWSHERKANDYLAEKARLKAHIEKCTEDGMVAVIRSGMDCDCTQYLDHRHIPAPSLMQWQRDEERHAEWLDGPEHTWIGKPSDYPEGHASSDRALEAYENGNMSRVTWTSLEIGG